MSASSTSSITRDHLIADDKNEAEGAPEEVKITLGWILKGGLYGAYKRDEYRGKDKGGRYYETSYGGQRGGGYKVEGYTV
jgi:hypothetical protein